MKNLSIKIKRDKNASHIASTLPLGQALEPLKRSGGPGRPLTPETNPTQPSALGLRLQVGQASSPLSLASQKGEEPRKTARGLVAQEPGRKPKRGGTLQISRVGAKNTKKVRVLKKQETLTEYQSQYKAKQQVKYFYGGISETSLRRLVKTTSKPAICEIEKRLDVVLFRLGFASTIFEARSLIKGGLVKINEVTQNGPTPNKSRELLQDAKGGRKAEGEVVGLSLNRGKPKSGLLSKTQVQVGSKITIDTMPTLTPTPLASQNNSTTLRSMSLDQGGNKGSRAGWKTSYLAKIQHLRQNLFKLPTHLIVASHHSFDEGGAQKTPPFSLACPLGNHNPPQASGLGVTKPRQLEGYFVKEPVESEVILPYKFPLNKLKYFLNSKK